MQKQYKNILVALDGSEDSLAGGRFGLEIAKHSGGSIKAIHVYDTKIHNTRFQEMEPGLPPQYRKPEKLSKLRGEHDTLMSDGFKSLSHGYMEEYLAQAEKSGVNVAMEAVEGRNYIGILKLLEDQEFDIVVLGATGLGAQQEGMLGSTALRVLRNASCDVLIARASAEKKKHAVVACIDGSDHALAAMQKGAFINAGCKHTLHLFGAYDVAFHRTIFKTMARSLPASRQEEIGLDRQEAVHEDLIDKSLEALYGGFLQDAAKEVWTNKSDCTIALRAGKGYRAILDYADEMKANLIVLGRFGHNREEISDIGSHAEAVARLASCHVLVSSGSQPSTQYAKEQDPQVEWDAEALQRLERIPAHVRQMAKKAIESQALADGDGKVTLKVFQEAAKNFGM